MIAKAVLWGIRRYIGGPGRSWLFTTLAMLGMRAAKSMTGRRELIDISDVKPGQNLVIEHLPMSHKKQIKSLKAEKVVVAKAEKSAAKDTKSRTRAQAKAEKAAARDAKARAKAEKAAARDAKARAKAEKAAARDARAQAKSRVKSEKTGPRGAKVRAKAEADVEHAIAGRRRLRRSRSADIEL